ncbi:hypothetical protein [Streptomyces bacillaris]|uniref:hypothetical protein n=1 Tax=Streptomyces bacillaris TaxID=68179 RepID=UPI00345FE892
MNLVHNGLSANEFSVGARKFIRSLHDAFLRDEDLVEDLNAVLGEDAGPIGLAGAKSQQRPPRRLFRRPPSTPSSRTGADLSRAVTRLDRMLGHLVNIAQEREWEYPYPNVAESIDRAQALRSQRPQLTGEFATDQVRLRRMAMVALDLLDALSDDEQEKALATGPASRTDGSRT